MGSVEVQENYITRDWLAALALYAMLSAIVSCMQDSRRGLCFHGDHHHGSPALAYILRRGGRGMHYGAFTTSHPHEGGQILVIGLPKMGKDVRSGLAGE